MSSQWRGLVQEKLFLAQGLFRQAGQPSTAQLGTAMGDRTGREADNAVLQAGLIQGGVALLLEARRGLLVLVAQLNQSKAAAIADLPALAMELGAGNADVDRLMALSQESGGWWQRLDQLQAWLRQPRTAPQRTTDDSLIAVALSEGPDLSPKALMRLADDFRQYLADLCQWHGEW